MCISDHIRSRGSNIDRHTNSGRSSSSSPLCLTYPLLASIPRSKRHTVWAKTVPGKATPCCALALPLKHLHQRRRSETDPHRRCRCGFKEHFCFVLSDSSVGMHIPRQSAQDDTCADFPGRSLEELPRVLLPGRLSPAPLRIYSSIFIFSTFRHNLHILLLLSVGNSLSNIENLPS